MQMKNDIAIAAENQNNTSEQAEKKAKKTRVSLATLPFVKSNEEIIEFYKEYVGIFKKACRDIGLDYYETDSVISSLLEKFGKGRLEFDPGKGTKASTFYYGVAKRRAIDEWRKRGYYVPIDMLLLA